MSGGELSISTECVSEVATYLRVSILAMHLEQFLDTFLDQFSDQFLVQL